MEHFPATLTPDETVALVDRIEEEFEAEGFGLWAVEVTATGALAGMVGLTRITFDPWYGPPVEVGWRLAQPFWGHGYATEAATAALEHGFAVIALPEIVAMTSVTNLRSQRVMQRLGMTRDPRDDFDHPRLPDGHRLQRHVLYRAERDRWTQQHARPPEDD